MSRPKGSKNKAGSTAKDNVLRVFELIGGVVQMQKWATSNQNEFYRLYSRLIPTAIEGKLEHEHKVPVPDESTLITRLTAQLAARTEPEKTTVQLDS